MNTIQELKLALLAKKYLKIFKGEFRMTLSWSLIGQIIATGVQAANAFTPFVAPQSRPVLASSIAALQAIGAVVAHFYTPNGTATSTLTVGMNKDK